MLDLDVFLSPLKPPTKDSVSAEAINASLYYLHVATPDDDVLLQEVEEEREEEARIRQEMGDDAEPETTPHEFARLNNVRRKPVPGGGGGGGARNANTNGNGNGDGSANATSPPSLATQENIPPWLSSMPEQRSQVPSSLPGSMPTTEFPRQGGQSAHAQRVQFLERRPTLSPIPRRPLPPVPNGESALESSGYPAKRHNRWSALAGYVNLGPESWKERHDTMSNRRSLDSRRPNLAPQPTHESPPLPARSPGQSPSRLSHDSRSPEPSPGFHITLIRRDPTHGTQWNVATISTPRLDDGMIDIEISTPGYNRFIAQDEPLSLENLGSLADGANAPSLAALQALQKSAGQLNENNVNINNANKAPGPPGPRRFRRKLCVSRTHQDEARGSTDQPGAVRGSIDSVGPGSPPMKPQQGLSKLKSGYYTFTSPWNGICTFATAVNGRNLKCKHMIPLQAPPGIGMDTMPANPAETVAEIRFNTPFQPNHLHHQPNPSHLSPFLLSQTPTFAANPEFDPSLPSTASTTTTNTNPAPTQPSQPSTSKRNSLALFLNPNTYNRPRSHSGNSLTHTHTNNLTTATTPNTTAITRKPSTHSTTSTTTATTDDPDRLDFTLARERAGGGMRGKSAKLGKLVVEDEGIKMLDLVVAACMGVWWRGYYY